MRDIEKWEYERLEEIPDFKAATAIADNMAIRAGKAPWEHPQTTSAYGISWASEDEDFGRKTTKFRRAREPTNKPRNFSTKARDRSVRYDYVYRGLSVEELAEKWGLSRRQIYRIIGNINIANAKKEIWGRRKND